MDVTKSAKCESDTTSVSMCVCVCPFICVYLYCVCCVPNINWGIFQGSKLGITHITTSPHHHQSNGLAEGHVWIVKNLSKAKETREDYHEVISVYCNTPVSGKLPSPCELLHKQKPNLDLPKWEKKCPVEVEDLCSKDKNLQTEYDNILPVGTNVMFITPPNKKWFPAVVKEYLGHRSYKIKTPEGVIYCHTRLHLKPYKLQEHVVNKPVHDATRRTEARPQKIQHAPVNLTCKVV